MYIYLENQPSIQIIIKFLMTQATTLCAMLHVHVHAITI